MTSTASKHRNYTGLVFVRTFKSRIVNMILALGASLVTIVIAVSASIWQNSYYDGITHTYIGDYDITMEACAVAVFLTAIAGFFSLSVAPKMFKQIYKKQSCDAYFSTPIRREEYFVANYCYGVLVNVLCYIIPLVLYGVATNLASNKYINYVIDYKLFIPVVITMLLAVIAIYSAFVMCAVISGKRIQYIFLSLICLICTSTTLAGIAVKVNSIWGLNLPLTTLSAISPVENAVSAMLNLDNLLPLIIISVIEIVGMFIVGYIAFKNRKAETAEMSLSGKIVPYIILAVLSSAAFFYSGTGNGVIDLVVGLILAVLISMVFSAVFYKKPFTKETAITTACVCAVCTILSVGVMLPIFNGYVKYVPDVDKIKSAELSTLNEGEEYAGLVSTIINSDAAAYLEGESIKLEEKENIEKIVALHNVSINDNVIKVAKKNSNSMLRLMLFLGDNFTDDYQTCVSYKITYKLNDGRVVTRSYSVPNNLIKEEYFNVFQTEEAIDQIEPFNIDESQLLATSFVRYEEVYDKELDYYDTENTDVELKDFDLDKFNEALKKDYLAVDQKEFITIIDSFESYLFDNEYYDYLYENDYFEVNLYVAEEDITDKQLEELKKLSKSQLITAIDEDWEGKTNAYSVFFTIRSSEKNTIEYLNSCGAGIKAK